MLSTKSLVVMQERPGRPDCHPNEGARDRSLEFSPQQGPPDGGPEMDRCRLPVRTFLRDESHASGRAELRRGVAWGVAGSACRSGRHDAALYGSEDGRRYVLPQRGFDAKARSCRIVATLGPTSQNPRHRKAVVAGPISSFRARSGVYPSAAYPDEFVLTPTQVGWMWINRDVGMADGARLTRELRVIRAIFGVGKGHSEQLNLGRIS